MFDYFAKIRIVMTNVIDVNRKLGTPCNLNDIDYLH